MKLSTEQKVELFKKLASKTTLEAGTEAGLAKFFKNSRAIRNKVYSTYQQVRQDPEFYKVTPEVVTLVETAMSARAVEGRNTEIVTDDPKEIKGLVLNIRDKTFGLIDKKLDRVSKSRAKLDALSFKDLGIIAGIAFDKSQILKGEATEHIAHYAKIDGNISPEDAMAMILKSREETIIKKNA